jgi:uncharacterized membrane protein
MQNVGGRVRLQVSADWRGEEVASMDVVILRVIHIGSGMFWVGGIFSFFLFVQPAALALGPGGAPFTFQLIHHRRFAVVLLSAAIVTVLVGIWLLVITSNGLNPNVLFSTSRLGFTVGGVVAILTLGVGGLYVFPRTQIVERTLARVLGEQRPPTPDEQAALAKAGRESRAAGWLVMLGLAVAVICMETASYWDLFF